MDTVSLSRLFEHSESPTLDFKLEHYKFPASGNENNRRVRGEFAKDIVCMANTPREESAFIVIGAKRHLDGSVNYKGVKAHIDDNDLQLQVDGLVQPKPRFHYHQIQTDGKQFGVIEIPAYQEIGPFMPSKDIEGVWRRNVLYWRNGTQNAEASPAEQKRIHAWFLRNAPLSNQIAEAFGRGIVGANHLGRVAGKQLMHLATEATEAGDLHAAEEAFLCLIRLAGKRGVHVANSSSIPQQDLISAAERALREFIATDFGLTISVLNKMRWLAPFGDSDYLKCDLASHRITSQFFAVVDVLSQAGRHRLPAKCTWADPMIAKTLAGLMMTSSMLLHFQGVTVPTPPEHLWVGLSGGNRTIAPDADIRTAPFVWVASRIARLDPSAFDAAMKALVYRIGIPQVGVDLNSGQPLDRLRNYITHIACLPNYAITVQLNAASKSDAASSRELIAGMKQIGQRAALASLDFLTRERSLQLSTGDTIPVEWLAESIEQRQMGVE